MEARTENVQTHERQQEEKLKCENYHTKYFVEAEIH